MRWKKILGTDEDTPQCTLIAGETDRRSYRSRAERVTADLGQGWLSAMVFPRGGSFVPTGK